VVLLQRRQRIRIEIGLLELAIEDPPRQAVEDQMMPADDQDRLAGADHGQPHAQRELAAEFHGPRGVLPSRAQRVADVVDVAADLQEPVQG
jgi:hypothetical protein